jgi:hypothetical protein
MQESIEHYFNNLEGGRVKGLLKVRNWKLPKWSSNQETCKNVSVLLFFTNAGLTVSYVLKFTHTQTPNTSLRYSERFVPVVQKTVTEITNTPQQATERQKCEVKVWNEGHTLRQEVRSGFAVRCLFRMMLSLGGRRASIRTTPDGSSARKQPKG